MAETDGVRRAARSRYWREEEARWVVAAWRASREAPAGFCRQHGLAGARVSRWAAQLGSGAPLRFRPVQLRAADAGEACRQVAARRAAGTRQQDLAVVVNVSGGEWSNPELVGEIGLELGAAGLPPEALRLEVTEGTLLSPPLEAGAAA